MKKYLNSTKLPIAYFLALSVYWFLDGFIGGGIFNYLALAVTIFLIILIISKNHLLGATFGLISCLLSFFFFLAVISEFQEFKGSPPNSLALIIVGTFLSLLSFIMAVILLRNNTRITILTSSS